MDKKAFSFKARLKSFTYAFQGWKVLIQNEHNARIHLVAAFLAVIGGFIFKISAVEWIIIVFAIGVVLAAEAFNSAIEYICNFVSPQYHELIKKVKDLSALAVLFVAMAALVAGFIIFIPKIIELCLKS
jgi:diacylglycerol kinase (ATP)